MSEPNEVDPSKVHDVVRNDSVIDNSMNEDKKSSNNNNNDDDDVVGNANHGGVQQLDEPITKKKNKRAAERQITQDDGDDDDDNDNDDGTIKIGQQKASAEVLATRRIIKAKRPIPLTHDAAVVVDSSGPVASGPAVVVASVGGNSSSTSSNPSTNGFAGVPPPPTKASSSSSTEENKPVNPFAHFNLVKTSSSTTTTTKKDAETEVGGPAPMATTKPKVFGSASAYSGFKTAAAATSGGGFGGFGSSSSAATTTTNTTPTTLLSGGFGSSTEFKGGFGSSMTASSSSSLGFFASSTMSGTTTSPDKGAVVATTTTEAPQTTTPSVSLFQSHHPSGTASVFSFGFGSRSDATSLAGQDGDDNNGGPIAAAVSTTTTTTINLPTNVQLTTGEEDEALIHGGRSKSYHWVVDEKDEVETVDSVHGMIVSSSSNPSVKPSTEFQTVSSSNSTTTNKRGTEDEETTTSKADGKGSMSSNDHVDTSKSKPEGGDDDDEGGDKTVTASTSAKAADKAEEHGRWQELGVGPIKILQSQSNPKQYRIVQRRESTKNGPATKVILNVPVWSESDLKRPEHAPQYLSLKTLVDGKSESYLFKFKESLDACNFEYYLKGSIKGARSAWGG